MRSSPPSRSPEPSLLRQIRCLPFEAPRSEARRARLIDENRRHARFADLQRRAGATVHFKEPLPELFGNLEIICTAPKVLAQLGSLSERRVVDGSGVLPCIQLSQRPRNLILESLEQRWDVVSGMFVRPSDVTRSTEI